ncbi:hypothetical protein KOR42_07050 [Thalassoglobus neptunius]|uniref:Uncharacterized protein n=1 Tax=Thalassoglobus neptunius TaxID=1938619 RepID=A0A5C5X553_9PLAN|nr:hypothetical protein [Thalassoglobus neptunius]TWT57345.1 hypothetical protein KOR42_07050 [Thalassoglobus neptunius]
MPLFGRFAHLALHIRQQVFKMLTQSQSGRVLRRTSAVLTCVWSLLCLCEIGQAGDIFSDECLSALSEPECSPYVACDAHSSPPVLRSGKVCFHGEKASCVAGPSPAALACCPYMGQPNSAGASGSTGDVHESGRCFVESDSEFKRWKESYEAAYGEKPSLMCRWQYKLVNWRYNSMYLEGCMPNGYSLGNFIQTVPRTEFHGGVLNSSAAIEPGGSVEEARAVEGDFKLSLSQISLDITPPQGSLPENRAEVLFAGINGRAHPPATSRNWSATTEYWNASLLNHQPLYFEDSNLERHGFSHGICQPVFSGVRFLGTVPILPYLIGANPSYETVYTLGETQPGDHACYTCEYPPFSLRGATAQGLATAGLILLIP